MGVPPVAHWAGVCSVLGGATWVAAALVQARQAPVCVGAACSLLSQQDASTETFVLFWLAGALLIAAGAGLLTLIQRHDGLGPAGLVGGATCVLALAALAATSTVQEVYFDGDFPARPMFVIPLSLALAVGVALVGWTILRSQVLPTWASVSLVVTAVLMAWANEQTTRPLVVVPFGLAWMAAGVALRVRNRRPARAPVRGRKVA